MKFIFPLFILLLFSKFSLAEPWLSTKFANNCAGCHSPGRINVKPAKRRCSLSCQGCHVNPNGGGIRNHYGKWNSQRWLKSFDAKRWIHGKKTPAPRAHQHYAKKYPKSVAPSKSSASKKDIGKILKPKNKRSIVLLDETPFKQDVYGKKYDTAFHYEAKKQKEFYKYLTREDPYITERKFTTTTNAELRYLYLTNSGDAAPGGVRTIGFADDSGAGFMAIDYGLRIRPKQLGLSFVLEQRHLGSPYDSDFDSIFRSGQNRSAYILWDELPYNTYVMAGLYRPMFGYYSANHRSLRETMAFGYATPGDPFTTPGSPIFPAARFGGAAGVRYEGLSIGATPTIPSTPFFNLHILTEGATGVTDGSSGFVANAGVRFVTLGLSGQVSFWNTKKDVAGRGELETSMFAFVGGMNLKGFIMNAEILNFSQEYLPGAKNEGSVITFELRKKIWRESYFTFSYASSNTSRTQFEGSATDLSIGYKLFAYAGTEIDFTYWVHTNDDVAFNFGETEWNSFQVQTHLYF